MNQYIDRPLSSLLIIKETVALNNLSERGEHAGKTRGYK